MAFVILGSVGSAIALGLKAVGLTTAATAVGSAAGAVSGVGSGIASGIGSGLMALGVPGTVGAGGAVGGAAGTIGTGITAAAGGAGMGAASSAAMGGDPGQGALMGGLTAGTMSGIGSLLGGAAGAGSAGSAVGDGLTTASEAMLNPTAAAAAPGATTVGDVATQTAMGQTGAAIPELATQAVAPTSSLFGGFGGDLTEMAVKEGMGMMKPEEGQVRVPRSGGGGRPKSRYDTEEQEQGMGNPFANPFAGFAEGGLTTLKGGGISMREGQYVVPADVVSAIGNGSSKAGAKFLEQAFNHYIQNGPPEGVKPQKRAGSLAEQRMQERVQRSAR
jgi:hypothetical protein